MDWSKYYDEMEKRKERLISEHEERIEKQTIDDIEEELKMKEEMWKELGFPSFF